ncbi:MAG: AzlD domain-containing protein [Chloroflexota bacterium]
MEITRLILGLALGTWLIRALPLTILSGMALPAWLRAWLRLVPGAVLAASLAQSLLVREDRLLPSWHNSYLLAAAPALVVVWRTSNMLLTMLVGMGAFALLQRWLG